MDARELGWIAQVSFHHDQFEDASMRSWDRELGRDGHLGSPSSDLYVCPCQCLAENNTAHSLP